MIKFSKLRFILALLAILFLSLLINRGIADAMPYSSKGYFTEKTMQDSSAMLRPILTSCTADLADAFPAADFRSNVKRKFVNALLDYYNNGDGCGIGYTLDAGDPSSYRDAAYNTLRNKTGAHFILSVLTDDRNKNFSPSKLIDRFTKAMDSTDITVDFESYTYTRNSAYGLNIDGVKDDAFINLSGTHSSIVIKYKNSVVAAIKSNCGNFVGDPIPLTSLTQDWTILPTVEIKNINKIYGSGYAAVGGFADFVYSGKLTVPPSPKNHDVLVNFQESGLISDTGTVGTVLANQDSATVTLTKRVNFDKGPGLYCGQAKIDQYANGTQDILGNIISSSGDNSIIDCITVINPKLVKPKVQIWGGDLTVGRSVSGAFMNSNVSTSQALSIWNATYGSWGEYALYQNGEVSGMASGTALKGGVSGTCVLNKLTFTNEGYSSGCSSAKIGGKYLYSSGMKNYSVMFSPDASVASGNVNLSNLPSGTYSVNGTSDLVITSGALPKGRSIIINAPDNNVKIASDIKLFSGAMSSYADLPQVVIIAKNIDVADSVLDVQAWLIASEGYINTCTIGGIRPTALDSTKCNRKLTITGPVLADKLYLTRTAGDTIITESGNPAEVFVLRADAFLWLYNYKNSSNLYKNVYTTELPPRL